MKRLLITILFVTMFIVSYGQGFRGFFRPVPDMFAPKELTADQAPSVWLFRPIVTVTAMSFTLGNPVTVASLSSMGTGLSYQHFIDNNGEAYNNYGFSALVLFSQDIGGVQPAKLCPAVTVSAFQYLNLGIGYSFADKKAFLLTGISYSFN